MIARFGRIKWPYQNKNIELFLAVLFLAPDVRKLWWRRHANQPPSIAHDKDVNCVLLGGNYAGLDGLEEDKPLLSNSAFRLRLGGNLLFYCNRIGWQNPAKWANAEEPFPARIAPVGWKAQPTLGEYQRAFLYPLARDTLQIEITAFWAVHKPVETPRRPAPVKPEFAGSAPPGTVSKQCGNEIPQPIPMRPVAFRAAALRANHPYPLDSRQNS